MILLTKLISGEEILSDTEVVHADGVPVCLLKQPCQVIMMPTERGMSVQLVPWMPYAKDHTVPIAADMLMTQIEVEQNLINQYNSAYGSGIQIPDNKIQLVH